MTTFLSASNLEHIHRTVTAWLLFLFLLLSFVLLWDDTALNAGVHEVRWHGEDGSGRQVASGEYIVRLLVAGHACSRKITLAR